MSVVIFDGRDHCLNKLEKHKEIAGKEGSKRTTDTLSICLQADD